MGASDRPPGPVVELWTTWVHLPGHAAEMARRAEEAGYDGIGFGDTQNLAADPYIGLVLAGQATSRIRLGVRVANPVTRVAAVTANAIATVQVESNGRAVLGIGRGDSSVAHIGGRPAAVADLERYLEHLQAYLGPDPEPDRAGGAARLAWLPADLPKVPVDVAATGPRTMAVAARWAEGLTVTVGADPGRAARIVNEARLMERPGTAPPLSVGAYLNVVPHPDIDVARVLVRGPAAAYARFSGQDQASAGAVAPEDEAVVRALAAHYDRTAHGRSSASHTRYLTDAFLERFTVIGPPERCIDRLLALAGVGLDRLVLVGPAQDGDPEDVRVARRLLSEVVVPGVKDALGSAATGPVIPRRS